MTQTRVGEGEGEGGEGEEGGEGGGGVESSRKGWGRRGCVRVLRFRVLGLRIHDSGLRSHILGLRFKDSGFGFGVFGFRNSWCDWSVSGFFFCVCDML